MEDAWKMSKQFMGVLMVLLQKSLLNQSDIVPDLESLRLYERDGEVFVSNPPEQLDLSAVFEEPPLEE